VRFIEPVDGGYRVTFDRIIPLRTALPTREFAFVELQGADYSTGLDSIWLLQPQHSCAKSTLVGIRLTFLFIAGYVLFNIEKAAYIYGYTLNGVDGHNEFRAVYMGFWIGLTVLFFVAAWKIEVPILGDIAALMVLLQALGRLLSFLLDGKPSERFIIVFFLELTSSLLGLLLRPKISTS
jgi:hypothetical protein